MLLLLRRILPRLLAIGGIAVIVLAYTWQGPAWVVKSLFLTVPMLLAAFTTRRLASPRANATDRHYIDWNGPAPLLCACGFYSLTGLAFFILWQPGPRPAIYFVVIALMASLVFAQILLAEHPSLNRTVLPQLFLLSFNIQWGIAFKPAFYFAGTDLMGHLAIVAHALSGQSLLTSLFPEYRTVPLFHTWIAQGTITSGISIEDNTFLLSWVSLALLVTCVHVFVLRITRCRRTALFAALACSLHPQVIYYASYPVPRALVLVFFMLLVLVWTRANEDSAWQRLGLGFLLILATVLTHHASLPPLFLIGLLLYFVNRIGGSPSWGPTIRDLSLFFTIWMVHWLFLSSDVLHPYMKTWWEGFDAAEAVRADFASGGDSLDAIWYSLLSSAFYWGLVFFTLHGAGVALNESRRRNAAILGLLVLVLLPVHIPSPLNLVSSHALWLYRLPLMTLPFVVATMGYGLADTLISRAATGEHPRAAQRVLASALLGAALTLGSITSPLNCTDSDLFRVPRQPTYFIDSEIATMRHVTDVIPPTGVLRSDYQVARDEYHLAAVQRTTITSGPQLFQASAEYVLLRLGQLDGGTLLFRNANGTYYAFGKESGDQWGILSRRVHSSFVVFSSRSTILATPAVGF